MSDRKGFRFYKGEAYWFFGIDRPIHADQISRFDTEFDEAIDKIMLRPRTKAARLTKKWRNHLTNITHDGYGSFRLDFDSELENYTDAELEAFYNDILEIVAYLPIVESIRNWISIEEDISYYLENDPVDEVLTNYIEAVLESGYRLEQCDVEDLFNSNKDPKIAQLIANDFLMRKLRGQDVVCQEVPAKQESLADCFDVA